LISFQVSACDKKVLLPFQIIEAKTVAIVNMTRTLYLADGVYEDLMKFEDKRFVYVTDQAVLSQALAERSARI
jgi:hypothetical protein